MSLGGRRVLVTGGTGFLGQRVVSRYLAAGCAVRVVGRERGSALPPEVDFQPMDLENPKEGDLAAFAGQDLVIHAAARLHAATPAEQSLQEQVNLEGTKHVVHAARLNKVPRFVYVSSTAAIGISDDKQRPADESFEFNLSNLRLIYNESKHRAEKHVLAANDKEFSCTVVNPGFTFGPDSKGYRGFEVLERVLRRRLVVCTHGGLSVVHVDDVADGIVSASARGHAGQRYILSGENVSFHQIASVVARVADQRKIIVTIPNSLLSIIQLYMRSRRRSDIRFDRRYAYRFYSSEMARRELGFAPRPFTDIVKEALTP